MNKVHNKDKFSGFFSFIPLILFFILNKYYDIFIATAALIITSLIAVIYHYIINKKIHTMSAITAIFAVFFGLLTIILKDETFIKIKVTIVNIVLAAILILGFAIKKNFLKLLLKEEIKLEDKGWDILQKIWIIFFLFFAIFNEILWRNISTDTWVSFKVFVFPILAIIFAIIQVPIFKKYIIDKK